MTRRIRLAILMTIFILTLPTLARAQDSDAQNEIGVVYYANGDSFKALAKEALAQGGRSKYTATVMGAHATVHLRVGESHVFRVCGVDPTRFKLFRFKSEGSARSLIISKNNIWIGGSKIVLSESEVPLTIQASESGCFKLTPKEALSVGEFGFSPTESLEAFMFGIGDIERSK